MDSKGIKQTHIHTAMFLVMIILFNDPFKAPINCALLQGRSWQCYLAAVTSRCSGRVPAQTIRARCI